MPWSIEQYLTVETWQMVNPGLEGNICSTGDKCKYVYSELYFIFNLKFFKVN